MKKIYGNNNEKKHIVDVPLNSTVKLFKSPIPDNKEMKNVIGMVIDDDYTCDMKVELSMEKMDEDCPELIKGKLFTDEDFAYYDRAAYIGSATYYTTFRFPKERFSDVLSFIAEVAPIQIEGYLDSIDAEIIFQDRN